jgi:hypothetical protein
VPWRRVGEPLQWLDGLSADQRRYLFVGSKATMRKVLTYRVNASHPVTLVGRHNQTSRSEL